MWAIGAGREGSFTHACSRGRSGEAGHSQQGNDTIHGNPLLPREAEIRLTQVHNKG
jgi:hypothetical protein